MRWYHWLWLALLSPVGFYLLWAYVAPLVR